MYHIINFITEKKKKVALCEKLYLKLQKPIQILFHLEYPSAASSMTAGPLWPSLVVTEITEKVFKFYQILFSSVFNFTIQQVG